MDKNNITNQTWDKVASAYQDKFMNLDLYDDTYDTFCILIQKTDSKIFEIGCGPGNITKYLLSKRPDFKIEAIDLAPNMIALAKENNPTANFKIMDCREINKLTVKFNGIVCGFCIPYLSRAECSKLILDCSELLHYDGIFYLSCIEGDYTNSRFETGSNGKDKMYVHYYSEIDLKKELEINNFELLELSRKEFPKADGKPSTHLIFIAKKLNVHE